MRIGNIILSIANDERLYLITNTIDSNMGYIIVNNGIDTISIEYGYYAIINKAYIPGRTIFSTETRNQMIKNSRKLPPNEEVFFSDFPDEDREQNIDDPTYYKYDTINNLIGKMMLPKIDGIGQTGFYIPKLPNGKSFSIYGKN